MHLQPTHPPSGGRGMALSMDEQRMLDEIERRLADEDPVLAARLTAFGPPGLGITLRSRRGRMLASLIALITLAVISVAAYAIVPLGLRHPARPRPRRLPASQPAVRGLRRAASPARPGPKETGRCTKRRTRAPAVRPSMSRTSLRRRAEQTGRLRIALARPRLAATGGRAHDMTGRWLGRYGWADIAGPI